MTGWKTSLDRYLTTPPDDPFQNWAEAVIEYFSDKFYEKNDYWILDNKGQCNRWMNKLYRKSQPPKRSAKIIERTFNIYIKNGGNNGKV